MRLRILLLLLAISSSVFAYIPSEQAKLSVLTCGSGQKVYKVYGHSAIRYQDPEKNLDIVYNYGVFSFDEPHFILRFIRGYNYYLLGREHYKQFIQRYRRGGESVQEQDLNLTHEEVKALITALEINAQPENRKYLYNVLLDNCATRVYEILERELEGGLIWANQCEDASYRDLLHEYNGLMPFSQLGIDIVFGTKADQKINCREQMFLPEKLMEQLADARKHDGSLLVAQTRVLVTGSSIQNLKEKVLFHLVFGLLLLSSLFFRFRYTKGLRGFRIVLYSLLGLASLVVVFIAFFSIHPTVWPNLNLIWINPLWLIIAIALLTRKETRPFWQKCLNSWAIIIALFLILGLAGVFFIHYGLIYILSSIIIVSYKKVRA